MTKFKIPVANPVLSQLAKKYVNQVLDSNWISSGKFCRIFEEKMADYLGVKHVLTMCSGSAACYALCQAIDVQEGDCIATNNVTYVATANAIHFSKAKPVFVEPDINTYCMQIEDLERVINLLDSKVKYVFYADILGSTTDIIRLEEVCNRYGIQIIGDCCESFSAYYNDESRVGSKHTSCFSGYANKTVFSGEGGWISTNDDELAEKISLFRGQGQKGGTYNHVIPAYNFRLTDMQAAILLANFEELEQNLAERKRVFAAYNKYLGGANNIYPQAQYPNSVSSHWMYAISTPNKGKITAALEAANIEWRALFKPMNQLPMYGAPNLLFPASKCLYDSVIVLPTYPSLTNLEIIYITDIIKRSDDS